MIETIAGFPFSATFMNALLKSCLVGYANANDSNNNIFIFFMKCMVFSYLKH